MAVYDATWALILAVIQNAAPADNATEQAFLKGKADAKMLFAPNVEVELQALWEDVVYFSAAHKACQAHYALHGDYGPQLDAEHERLNGIAARLTTIPALFSEEMGFRVSF